MERIIGIILSTILISTISLSLIWQIDYQGLSYAKTANHNYNTDCLPKNSNSEQNISQRSNQTALSSEKPSFSKPISIAYDCKNGKLYVINKDSNFVSVVNSENYKVIKHIRLPHPYNSIIYNSVNNRLYLTDYAGTEVCVINPKNNTVVQTIQIPHAYNVVGFGLAFNPINGNVYDVRGNDIVSFYTTTGSIMHEHRPATLNIISAKNGSIIKTIEIPDSEYPKGIAFDPVNGHIYIHNKWGAIEVFDSSTYELVKTITISSWIQTIEFNQKNGNIYALGSGLYVIDGKSMEIIKTISFSSIENHDLTIDSQTGNVYVGGDSTYYNLGEVSVINGTTNELIKTQNIDPKVDALAFDPKNGSLYVVDTNANSVNVMFWARYQIWMEKTVY